MIQVLPCRKCTALSRKGISLTSEHDEFVGLPVPEQEIASYLLIIDNRVISRIEFGKRIF